MKIDELLEDADLERALKRLDKLTARTRSHPDDIRVNGYVVRAHWRMRSKPVLAKSRRRKT